MKIQAVFKIAKESQKIAKESQKIARKTKMLKIKKLKKLKKKIISFNINKMLYKPNLI